MARINYNAKIPSDISKDQRESRISRDLREAERTFISLVPRDNRRNIQVISGEGDNFPLVSIGQLDYFYQRDGRISLTYEGPVINGDQRESNLGEVEIYQTLKRAKEGDSYRVLLRDGREVEGVPIFNQSKGLFRMLDMDGEIAPEISIEDIKDVRKCD